MVQELDVDETMVAEVIAEAQIQMPKMMELIISKLDQQMRTDPC